MTGASGFVGSHLTNRLAELGNEIVAVDARPPRYALQNEVSFIQADITDPESLNLIEGEFDVVVNLSSLFKYSASRDLLLRVNVFGAENLMKRIERLGVEKVVHASSGAIYGFVPRNEQPIPETREPKPSNDYELSKWLQEKLVQRYCEELGLKSVVLRPAAIYGEGSRYGAIKAITMYVEGKLWFIPGAGTVKPGLVSVDDVVGFIVHALRNQGSTFGKTFNIADDGLRTLEELMLQVSEEAGVPRPKMKMPASIVRFVAKAEEVKAKLYGREPEFTLSEAEYLLHERARFNRLVQSFRWS